MSFLPRVCSFFNSILEDHTSLVLLEDEKQKKMVILKVIWYWVDIYLNKVTLEN